MKLFTMLVKLAYSTGRCIGHIIFFFWMFNNLKLWKVMEIREIIEVSIQAL